MARFFTVEEEEQIAAHIRLAELRSTGEVRVFIEPRCTGEVGDRALYIFGKHKVFNTAAHNGVLIYMAYDSRLFYIWGDSGIHAVAGQTLWDSVIREVTEHFKKGEYLMGILHAIDHIGNELEKYFPRHAAADTNELPDDIIYGNSEDH